MTGEVAVKIAFNLPPNSLNTLNDNRQRESRGGSPAALKRGFDSPNIT